MFKIFIAYLARNRIWQNLPVIIAILAKFSHTHKTLVCAAIRIYLFQTSVFFFFNGENWPILHQKFKKKKKFPATWVKETFWKISKKIATI
jgi:hypothetical protein